MHSFRDDLSIVLSGEAGQGIQTIEILLTRLLKKSGYHVFATKEYMSRVRGGINSTTIRISSGRVAALREKIDILIPLHKDCLKHLKERMGEDTLVIGERERIGYPSMLDAPFTKIAMEIGGAVYANSVAVGMVAGIIGADLKLGTLIMAGHFKGKPEELLAKNDRAFLRGAEIGEELRKNIDVTIQRHAFVSEELMVTGAEAVALGALAGGCDYVCAYPMSPSTAVLVQLAALSKQVDLIVEQVEDETGVVNMALGAWYAGARAMVTTSGGGFALMTEGISLAGMLETPLVVHLAQRPGPATGLPTRTEQGDLNLVLYAGHGYFPRIVLAPRNIDDAFYLSRRAFNLADKYQVPVFILTDQYLMDTYYNMPPWDAGESPVERFIAETKEDYRRYEITANGISPRGVPGFGKGIVCVDSDEHDEGGYITESASQRERMVEKRLRKGATVKEDAIPPVLLGRQDCDVLCVAWGSTCNALSEAFERSGGDDFSCLLFSWLFPLPDNLGEMLAQTKNVIVIEGNATGQFADLLEHAAKRSFDRILKYNGMPFSVEELVREITARL